MITKLLVLVVIFSLCLSFAMEASTAYLTDKSSFHTTFNTANCFKNCGGEALITIAPEPTVFPEASASATMSISEETPAATPFASPSPSAEPTVMPTPTTAPQPDELPEFENNDDQTGSYIDEVISSPTPELQESPVPNPTPNVETEVEAPTSEEIITP